MTEGTLSRSLVCSSCYILYLLIKYIKSVLWRVAKRLPYIEDARCPKVKVPLPPTIMDEVLFVQVLEVLCMIRICFKITKLNLTVLA